MAHRWSICKLCDPSGLPVGGVFHITVFFCLSKQNKRSLKGMEANAGMINTAVGCRDTYCSQVRVGLWKSRKKEGELGCFKGSKQNIMRKKGGRKKKMLGGLLGRNWGQVFPTKTCVRHTLTFLQHTLMSATAAGSHSAPSKTSNILSRM